MKSIFCSINEAGKVLKASFGSIYRFDFASVSNEAQCTYHKKENESCNERMKKLMIDNNVLKYYFASVKTSISAKLKRKA